MLYEELAVQGQDLNNEFNTLDHPNPKPDPSLLCAGCLRSWQPRAIEAQRKMSLSHYIILT